MKNGLPDHEAPPVERVDDPSAAQVDELAKGLPGLPLRLERGRVDERGFNLNEGVRREVRVAWEEVTGFRVFWHGQFVIEAQSPDAVEVRLVPLRAARTQRKVFRVAWREYVLRRIERDGALRGSYFLLRPGMQSFGALLLGSVTVLPGIPLFLSGVPGPAPELVDTAFRVLGGMYVVVGLLALVAGFILHRGAYRTRLHWYRWELKAKGLTFWPLAEETELVPSAGDSISRDAARVGEVRIPLEHLTYREPLGQMLVAMGERAAADIRALRWSRPTVLIAPAVALWVIGPAAAIVGVGYDETAPFLCAVATIPLTTALAAVWFRAFSRSRLKRDLADGRAMLERLGW